MKIKHHKGNQCGSFEIEDNGNVIAEMTYVKNDDNCIIIDHTGVNNTYRGQNFGKKLVEEAVNYARNENLKIIPVCSYAKAIMSRNHNYRDVLK